MKNIFFAALLMVIACKQGPESAVAGTEIPPMTQEELIKRGAYLVNTSACHDCHSPKIMTPEGPVVDPERMLSGHPQEEVLPPLPANSQWVLFSPGLTSAVGPWGQSFSANLTPDDTGIGAWSFEQFETAIRKGKFKGLEGSRPLLPPMPWEMYKNFTDEDLQSIFAYLKSIKPVKNLVPPPIAPTDLLSLNVK